MQDDTRLAVALRTAQWELDEVAFALPRGEITHEQRTNLAATLATLAELLGNSAQTEVIPGHVIAPGEPRSVEQCAADARSYAVGAPMCQVFARYREDIVDEGKRVCHVVTSASEGTEPVLIALCGQVLLRDVVELLDVQDGTLCLGCSWLQGRLPVTVMAPA